MGAYGQVSGERKKGRMNTKDLICKLELEYYGLKSANPGTYDVSLAEFLESRGVSRDDIWQHRPSAARAAGWKEPDWL